MKPTEQLFELAAGGWIAKAVAVAAELDIAGLLDETPLTHVELVEATGSSADVLLNLLGLLVSRGVFVADVDGRFANNELSTPLIEGRPESMRHLVRWMAGVYDTAWCGLLPAVRHGGTAFEHQFGLSLYAYLAGSPEAERAFHLAMEDATRPTVAELTAHYDFSGVRHIVDVGGGNGGLLKGLLTELPDATGTCADRREVCDQASAELASTDPGFGSRLDFRAADLFSDVPRGKDLYILKNVLHDWNPDSAQRILHTVRAAMSGPDARLLVIEPLFARGSLPGLQLLKMVICEEGTQLHAPEEMQHMAEIAGFRVTRTFPVASGQTVLVCALDG
ncbi:methyltransferase [Embleya sp. AB8]|uniref:methyltransferase n=1 Tax=Embleya sp. AB8 TaxID=3156304 RepID=UPI003C72E0DB